MSGPRSVRAVGGQPSSILALCLFAAVMFAAGWVFSLRQVREAQHAAGEAERQKMNAEAALAVCQDRLLILEREIEKLRAAK